MKKQYKKTTKQPSIKVDVSKMIPSVFALYVDGCEIKWGDKKTMEAEREMFVKKIKI